MMNAHHAFAARAALQRRPRVVAAGAIERQKEDVTQASCRVEACVSSAGLLVNSIQGRQPLRFIGAIDDGDDGDE
jgi:hypothetical protein